MRTLGIIGSGDLGQLIAHHAIDDNHFDEIVFFDDFKKAGEVVDGHKVMGNLDAIELYFKSNSNARLIIAIGYKHIIKRKEVFEKYHQKIPFGTIIHSACYVDDSALIGDGTVLLPGCVLDRNVIIGNNVLLNTACVIAHDSKIGSHSFLSPAVKVAGFVEIAESCVIGINTTVIDNIKIESNIQTGGGTVVIENLTKAGLYVGNPARFIR